MSGVPGDHDIVPASSNTPRQPRDQPTPLIFAPEIPFPPFNDSTLLLSIIPTNRFCGVFVTSAAFAHSMNSVVPPCFIRVEPKPYAVNLVNSQSPPADASSRCWYQKSRLTGLFPLRCPKTTLVHHFIFHYPRSDPLILRFGTDNFITISTIIHSPPVHGSRK